MLTTFSTGKELKLLRARHSVTQAKLAKRAGLSQSLIARIETGTVNPRLSTMLKINNALYSKTGGEGSVEGMMSKPVIYTVPKEKVSRAIAKMEKHNISQLPVMDKGKSVGSLLDTNLVMELTRSSPEKLSSKLVEDVMSPPFKTVDINDEPERLFKLLRRERALLVMRDSSVAGIITKADVLEMVMR
jgi:predicted transcriptional regulator